MRQYPGWWVASSMPWCACRCAWQGHPCVLSGQVPFNIFTATVVYPAFPFSLKAVASTTFPNSPSPRVFPRTKFFRGNSHFGSSYIGVKGRERKGKGRKMVKVRGKE